MESPLNHTPALWFQILVILLTALSAVLFYNQDYSVTGGLHPLHDGVYLQSFNR